MVAILNVYTNDMQMIKIPMTVSRLRPLQTNVSNITNGISNSSNTVNDSSIPTPRLKETVSSFGFTRAM